MARFYHVLPHQLLDLEIPDWRLAYKGWVEYVREQDRQATNDQNKADAMREAARLGGFDDDDLE